MVLGWKRPGRVGRRRIPMSDVRKNVALLRPKSVARRPSGDGTKEQRTQVTATGDSREPRKASFETAALNRNSRETRSAARFPIQSAKQTVRDFKIARND